MNLDALVTATEASAHLPDVSRHLIAVWAHQGKLAKRGNCGRSPLYRWGDILAVERDARTSGMGRPRKHDLAA